MHLPVHITEGGGGWGDTTARSIAHKEVWHLHADTLVIVMDTHAQNQNIFACEIQLKQKYSWTWNKVWPDVQLNLKYS